MSSAAGASHRPTGFARQQRLLLATHWRITLGHGYALQLSDSQHVSVSVGQRGYEWLAVASLACRWLS
jgi:hypothetical protein